LPRQVCLLLNMPAFAGHTPGRADFPHPVLHGRVSLAVGAEDAIRDSPVEKRTEVMMSPPSSSPVRLSVVVSWTGSRSPRSPPVFPGNGSHPAAPPFPRAGPGEPSSPRSAALRRRYDFPPAHPRSLICFASGVRATLRSSCSPCRRSRMVGGPVRARAFGQPAAQLPARSHVDASGISQVPRRSIPCLCPGPRPRPDRRSLTLTVSSMLPPLNPQRRLQRS
jgi:hypothetical protein